MERTNFEYFEFPLKVYAQLSPETLFSFSMQGGDVENEALIVRTNGHYTEIGEANKRWTFFDINRTHLYPFPLPHSGTFTIKTPSNEIAGKIFVGEYTEKEAAVKPSCKTCKHWEKHEDNIIKGRLAQFNHCTNEDVTYPIKESIAAMNNRGNRPENYYFYCNGYEIRKEDDE